MAPAVVAQPVADAERRAGRGGQMQPVAMGVAAVALALAIELAPWVLNLDAQLAEARQLSAVASHDAAFTVIGSAAQGLGRRVGGRGPLRCARPRGPPPDRSASSGFDAEGDPTAVGTVEGPDDSSSCLSRRISTTRRHSRSPSSRSGSRHRPRPQSSGVARGLSLGRTRRRRRMGFSYTPVARCSSPTVGCTSSPAACSAQGRRDAAPAPTLLHRRPPGPPGEAAPRHADRRGHRGFRSGAWHPGVTVDHSAEVEAAVGPADIVAIEEGQFFDEALPEVVEGSRRAANRWSSPGSTATSAASHSARCHGLALADQVTKLTAICMVCAAGDPDPAADRRRAGSGGFAAHRHRGARGQTYEARCRLHHVVPGLGE